MNSFIHCAGAAALTVYALFNYRQVLRLREDPQSPRQIHKLKINTFLSLQLATALLGLCFEAVRPMSTGVDETDPRFVGFAALLGLFQCWWLAKPTGPRNPWVGLLFTAFVFLGVSLIDIRVLQCVNGALDFGPSRFRSALVKEKDQFRQNSNFQYVFVDDWAGGKHSLRVPIAFGKFNCTLVGSKVLVETKKGLLGVEWAPHVWALK